MFKPVFQFRLLALAALLLLPVAQAGAHAVVTHSSLSVGNVAPNQPTQVRLTFNSKVELDLSQIFLVSAGDKMELVNASYSDQPGTVVIDLPALDPGEYALKLSIFAADGHLSEDIVRFQVTHEAE